MKPFVIGSAGKTPVLMDPLEIIDSKLLGCCNSGGGKSWLLRALIEQVAMTIPTIVIDPEGEFASLREKLDMVLVGPKGEIPADPRLAKRLCRKLIQLRLSAVIDLSDLDIDVRCEFVRIFIESLLALPENLWHPTLIVIDEATDFCPGASAGRKSTSTKAILNMMRKGRKRGYGVVLATQRLPDLHTGARGECNNVMLGRFVLDIDLNRACKVLGKSNKDHDILRTLQPGEFYGFGPAFVDHQSGVVKFRTRKVETTHPTSRTRYKLKPPAPSAKTRKALIALGDLPAQEAEEVATLTAAQDRIVELGRTVKRMEREAKARPKPVAVAAVATTVVKVDEKAFGKAVEKAVTEAITDLTARWEARATEMRLQIREGTKALDVATRNIDAATKSVAPVLSATQKRTYARALAGRTQPPVAKPAPAAAAPSARATTAPRQRTPVNGASKVGTGAQRKILVAMAQYPDGITVHRIGALTGLQYDSGHTKNVIRDIRDFGWSVKEDREWVITEDGLEALGDFEVLPTGSDLIDWWAAKLGGGLEARLFTVVQGPYPDSVSSVDAAAELGVEASGGHYKNVRRDLRDKGLITLARNGEMRGVDELHQ